MGCGITITTYRGRKGTKTTKRKLLGAIILGFVFALVLSLAVLTQGMASPAKAG